MDFIWHGFRNLTRYSKKNVERCYAEFFSNFFGEDWCIVPSESPDFIIYSDRVRFGLEVREVSVDIENRSGSKLKRAEGDAKQRLRLIQEKFHKTDETPIKVEFLINLEDYSDQEILQVLLDMHLGKNPRGYKSCFEFVRGGKIYATHAYVDQWNLLKHEVGWVMTDRTPEGKRHLEQIFENAIRDKAKNINKYKGSGLTDIRLLLVANRRVNSGKILLEGLWELSPHGFSMVYFLSFPDTCTIIAK